MTFEGALFDTGQILITPQARDVLHQLQSNVCHVDAWQFIKEHVTGEWGDIPEEDRRANNLALRTGGRLMSVFLVSGIVFWVITEADRSATTILLPTEG
jgi:hypothetical protein